MTTPRKVSLKAQREFAHVLADISGAAILPYFRRPLAVKNKGADLGFDPVTAADRVAERLIRKAIRQRFPDHGLIGEEYGTVAAAGPYTWLVDPIDGTRAFITGSPLWGTLIGLLDAGKPTLGVMNQPFTGERFWSDASGAYWRGPGGEKKRRIKTRACGKLADSVLATTHPDLFATPAEVARFGALKARARMTRFGGDCYGYCLLAAGCIDIIVETSLKPYDIAPLVPIIEGAGGIVTTWEGAPAADGGRIVAAGDRRVHAEALSILRGTG